MNKEQLKDEITKVINDEIAETPNDNNCCREVLLNVRQKLKELE